MKRRIGTSGAPFTGCIDRFVTEGYKPQLSRKELVLAKANTEGIDGLSVGLPCDEEYLAWFKGILKQYNKQVNTVCPDTYMSPRLKDGMLVARDPGLRREFIEHIKQAMDLCAEVNGNDILLWQAHDGYSYPFEDDYTQRWGWLLEGLDEVCAYRDDVKVTIEYKCKEPKTRQYISDVGKSLFICEQLKERKNLGIVVDIGHSLIVDENPAEALALAAHYGKLFHVHLNDNYRNVDDDLMVGAIHFWETLEFFYEMDMVGYDGWLNLDIWPSYIDGPAALRESIKRVRMFENLVENLPREEIRSLQRKGDLVKAMEIVRKTCIKEY